MKMKCFMYFWNQAIRMHEIKKRLHEGREEFCGRHGEELSGCPFRSWELGQYTASTGELLQGLCQLPLLDHLHLMNKRDGSIKAGHIFFSAIYLIYLFFPILNFLLYNYINNLQRNRYNLECDLVPLHP